MIRRPQWRRVKQGIAWIFSDPGGAARQHRRHCSLKFRHSQEQTVDSEFYQALRTGHGSRLSLEFTRSWTHWGCTTWKNTLYASTKVLQHLSFAALQCRGLMRTSTARQLDRRRGGGAAGVLPAGSGSAQGRGGWRSGRAHPWQPFLGCSFGGPHPLSSFPTRTHTVWHFSLLYAGTSVPFCFALSMYVASDERRWALRGRVALCSAGTNKCYCRMGRPEGLIYVC